ncbi:major facilitator superfamily domain-containing protein [Podospora didyma]|uniref:Major facilitator superfamily domain-containing protein n=1 Tax=Podospora didyma TaxID=330526 RepID=A0AAE0NIB3_9PEZI|nr:major facilitator superfamily domain-containing protein [Podospora didyma]
MDRYWHHLLLYAVSSSSLVCTSCGWSGLASDLFSCRPLVGSLALSAEVIIGSLIPVFLLYYSGVDVHILNTADFAKISGGSATGVNPFAILPKGVIPADIAKISMLATVPLLANGIASYFLVPLSIAIGRRPVLLFAGVCAWAGGIWAGTSTSLESHLAARSIQGLGAGAVEALIPLIIQDIVFIHQRNRAMSAIVSSQGIIITGLGIAAPYIASNYDWRWLYFITSGVGIAAWLLLLVFLPETRWMRSKEELSGQQVYPLEPGKNRPALNYATYSAPTKWTYMGFFQTGFEWQAAGMSMLNSLRTALFPAVVWATIANSIFIVVNTASQQIGSFALLAQGWQFQWTGLSVLPFIAATGLVYLFGGPIADRIANAAARRNGGSREPEHHLLNIFAPFAFGIAGTFIFGWAGQTNAHWAILMVGSFMIIFAFLVSMSVLNVFIVESYPMWAGPVLVNVSSIRLIIAFFLSSHSVEWVATKGFLRTFAVFGEVMIVASLGIPALYFFGKRVRQWTAGRVGASKAKKVVEISVVDEKSNQF